MGQCSGQQGHSRQPGASSVANHSRDSHHRLAYSAARPRLSRHSQRVSSAARLSRQVSRGVAAAYSEHSSHSQHSRVAFLGVKLSRQVRQQVFSEVRPRRHSRGGCLVVSSHSLSRHSRASLGVRQVSRVSKRGFLVHNHRGRRFPLGGSLAVRPQGRHSNRQYSGPRPSPGHHRGPNRGYLGQQQRQEQPRSNQVCLALALEAKTPPVEPQPQLPPLGCLETLPSLPQGYLGMLVKPPRPPSPPSPRQVITTHPWTSFRQRIARSLKRICLIIFRDVHLL